MGFPLIHALENMRLPLSICLLSGNRNLVEVSKESPLSKLVVGIYRDVDNTLGKIWNGKNALRVTTELAVAIGAGRDTSLQKANWSGYSLQ